MSEKIFSAVVLCLFLLFQVVRADGPTCSYSTYKWNTHARQAVDYRTVRRPYSQLRPEEIDAGTGCTVCEEDQVEIDLPGIRPFRVCRLLEHEIRRAFFNAIQSGEVIRSVVGYRVGMTRGDVDSNGNRTRFSNHSFGIAIDINEQQNGLYDRCISFGATCRLRRGGPWIPGRAGSLGPDSPIVQEFKRIGFNWGGEIEGRQKDFMHFSPSGY